MENTFYPRLAGFLLALAAFSFGIDGMAQESADSSSVSRIDEVVVTGSRMQTDVRHLSQTVTVIDRSKIENSLQQNVLPVLTEQIPGLFVTSRGIMGYGISGGSAGNISLRGLSGGSSRFLMLIDGHPQYADIRSPDLRFIPVLHNRESGNSPRAGFHALWLERHGRRREHRDPQDA